MAFSLAYPVGDMILIVGVASLLLRGVADSMRTALWLVTAGLCLFVVGDVLYAVHDAARRLRERRRARHHVHGGALLVHLRGPRPGFGRTRPDRHPRRLIARAGCRTSRSRRASRCSSISEVNTESGSLIVAIAAATLAALVSARQLLAQRELIDLQGQLRTQATTDALTGLGNRRKLLADLQCHVGQEAERPALLALFDLNGFKNYNDTFGHPAGDALLVRLGSALEEAVAPFGGRAYRPGGDEYCVIADATRRHALELAAGHALTETGEGFAISAAFGIVAVSGDINDADEAMRQADVAMYAQKQSGRATAGRQSTDVLMRALTERHPDLGDHHHGVADLVAAVAARLDIDGDELTQLRQATTLHDIGKVAIPDTILNKPGALDQAEWAFVRDHPLIGERIVAAAPALGRTARLVRSSHEAYDGSGYPDGLAGADIPLGARIIAVCDAFDAMISDAPQRDPDDDSGGARRVAPVRRDPVRPGHRHRVRADHR